MKLKYYSMYRNELVSSILQRSIILSTVFLLLGNTVITAQTNPAITSWLINTTNIMGRHYVKGNSTPINDNVLANVQTVQYSAASVYISTKGIPAYITGPFLDGNPSVATSQNAIFKFPLNPVQNTGTPTNTTGGNIGVFINGVALFDFRDAASWQNASNSLKGGPYGGMGDGVWNRDAVVGERLGFDCAKAHPAMGNYHHHQNPSAFKLDLNVISNVCDAYASDGLYAIDASKHSPLIGFAYDGFPIYGAYSYKNVDGTGGIVRMKSSYGLRNITTRTTYANGSTVTAGPAVSATYPLGTFREDYQYNATSAATPDYLDEHNGRFCVTPEYPNGIYCYFTTVDENWNSAYPYVVGPTFYGVKSAAKVASIGESVTNYTNASTLAVSSKKLTVAAPNNSTKTFEITSNVDWTLSSDQAWLTANKQNGNGNSTITLSAQENTSVSTRTATITVTGTGVTTQIIEVTQDGAAPLLAVSQNTLSIAAPLNSTTSFDITSNINWNVESNQTWLAADNANGTGNALVTLTAQENSNGAPRSATITVSGTGVGSQTIIVTQEGTGPSLLVSKNTLTIDAAANSTKSFEITSNVNWSLSTDQTWVTANKTNGTGNETIILTAQENANTALRTAKVTVTGTGVGSKEITVTQSGKGITLTISTDTLLISAAANGIRTFDITSNTTWTAKSNQNWLVLNSYTGSGDATVTVAAQANTDSTSRQATVTVEATGASNRVVSITQKGQKTTGVSIDDKSEWNINIYPNPTSDMIAVQVNSVNYDNLDVELYDNSGKFIQKSILYQGSTIAIFDTRTLYSGEYTIRIIGKTGVLSKKVLLIK